MGCSISPVTAVFGHTNDACNLLKYFSNCNCFLSLATATMDHLETWTICVLVRIGHVSSGEDFKIISLNLFAKIVAIYVNINCYKFKLKT